MITKNEEDDSFVLHTRVRTPHLLFRLLYTYTDVPKRFKGGDDTFGEFPEHLRALVSHGLPKVDVRAITYPKYETRGDLGECVSRFRDWYNFSLELSS